MFKITKGFVPNYLLGLFNFQDNSHFSLRNNKIEFSLAKPNTNFLKKSFSYRGAASRNSLPSFLLQETFDYSIASFKKKIKTVNLD